MAKRNIWYVVRGHNLYYFYRKEPMKAPPPRKGTSRAYRWTAPEDWPCEQMWVKDYHRLFSKAVRLRPGGGPIELELP